MTAFKEITITFEPSEQKVNYFTYTMRATQTHTKVTAVIGVIKSWSLTVVSPTSESYATLVICVTISVKIVTWGCSSAAVIVFSVTADF